MPESAYLKPPRAPCLWQKLDGTVLQERPEGWFYLSPLFGEWLPIFKPTEEELRRLKPYPANLEIRQEVIDSVLGQWQLKRKTYDGEPERT